MSTPTITLGLTLKEIDRGLARHRGTRTSDESGQTHSLAFRDGVVLVDELPLEKPTTAEGLVTYYRIGWMIADDTCDELADIGVMPALLEAERQRKIARAQLDAARAVLMAIGRAHLRSMGIEVRS